MAIDRGAALRLIDEELGHAQSNAAAAARGYGDQYAQHAQAHALVAIGYALRLLAEPETPTGGFRVIDRDDEHDGT